jgi:hypothetical protein
MRSLSKGSQGVEDSGEARPSWPGRGSEGPCRRRYSSSKCRHPHHPINTTTTITTKTRLR